MARPGLAKKIIRSSLPKEKSRIFIFYPHFYTSFFNFARTPHADFSKLLIPPFHLLTMFVPDFFGNPATRNYWPDGTYIERVSYIGIVPLFFIIYSFFQKKSKFFWFF